MGNSTGKLKFSNGKCLMARANLSKSKPTIFHQALAGCCDSSLDAFQTFTLTSEGHVRLADPPYLELVVLEGIPFFGETGNVVASDKCLVGHWTAPGFGASAAEVRGLQAVLVLVGVMACIYVSLCLHHALGWASVWALRGLSVGVLLSSMWGGGADEVRQLVAEFRRDRLKRCSRGFTIVGSCTLCWLMWRFLGVAWPSLTTAPEVCGQSPRHPVNAGQAIYETELVPVTISCLGMLVIRVSPRQRVTVWADALNVWLSLSWAFLLFTTTNTIVDQEEKMYPMISAWALMCRIIQALVLGNARLTTVLAVAVSSAEHFILSTSMHRYAESSLPQRIPVSCMLIVGLAWFAEFSAWYEASARIEVRSSRRSEALLSKLLSSFCDAVVRLDASLNIVQHAPKLGAMLLRTSSSFGDPSGAKGPIPFLNMVHPEDREALSSWISSSSCVDEEVIAPSIHVRLLDSLGSVAPVSIVGSAFTESAGACTTSHMLGISMLSEEPLPPQVEGTLLATALGSDGRSLAASSVGSAASSGVSSSSLHASPLTITVSYKAKGGTVISAGCNSPKALRGKYDLLTLLGVQFQSHVSDQAQWNAWFNDVMRQVIGGEVTLPHVVHLGPTFIRLAKSKRAMMDVTVCFPESENLLENLDDYAVIVHLVRTKEGSELDKSMQKKIAATDSEMLKVKL